MPLDRTSIEKKDFPISERGYEPAAVDAHLAALADEVEELKRSRPSGSLAASSSEQVRAIVEAAEKSASQIRRDAEHAAQQIREEANVQARTTHEQAASQARGYLDKVSATTSTTIQRLEAMKNELGGLLESLRRTAPPAPRSAPSAVVTRTVETPPAEPATTGTEAHADNEDEGNGRSEDAESARLIALNMALSDTPRDEIERYLAAHYRLTDRDKLLDEVYASVHG